MNLAGLTRLIRCSAVWAKRSPTARAIRTWAEYFGKLAVVFGVLGFIVERPDRAKQKYYQAWQLINAAKQSWGDAGRRVAIRDLIEDHAEMRGIELNDSNFEEMDFRSAIMPSAEINKSNIKGANFSCKAGLYVNNYWLPEFRFCWPTVLDGAEIASEIWENDFSNASLRKIRLGLPPDDQQQTQFKNGQKLSARAGDYGGSVIGLHKANFSNADMEGAVLRNQLLIENDFSGAKMIDASFFNCGRFIFQRFGNDCRLIPFLVVDGMRFAIFDWKTITDKVWHPSVRWTSSNGALNCREAIASTI